MVKAMALAWHQEYVSDRNTQLIYPNYMLRLKRHYLLSKINLLDKSYYPHVALHPVLLP